uniref:Uncharacterized protein n=1 Tax=Rhizophora mucronata TaxID=61149 RepID=A0A2P2R3W5_RHIMU
MVLSSWAQTDCAAL